MFGVQRRQGRHIAAYEFARRVKLLALANRVKDAEIRLRIAAAGADPLPAAVVGRQIKIVEVLGEVALAPAPVNAQVLDQKTARHHAQAVVHIAALVQLGHGRIHQRVAGAPLAPGSKAALRDLALFPNDGVVLGLEAGERHMREVGQYLRIKLAPHQFGQPHAGALVARAVRGQRPVDQLADGHGAKTQMHAQVAGPLDGGKVARLLVGAHARRKVGQQRLRTGRAGQDAQGLQIGRFKADVLQAGRRLGQGGRARRQGAAQGAAVVLGYQRLAHAGQPGAQIGRENAIGLAGLGQNFLALKDHMVFHAAPGDALARQRSLHLGVTRQGLRLIVVGAVDGMHAQFGGQLGDFIDGPAMAHDQPRAGMARQRAQLGVQTRQRTHNELHAPVGPGQGVQDVAVQHKDAVQARARLQGGGQGGVVFQAQVAAQPHQCAAISVLHACR